MQNNTILIAGGSGFIGRAATGYFIEQGWNVEWLSRNANAKAGIKTHYWNPALGQMDREALSSAGVVLNLAGLSLAEGNWTKTRKKDFEESRIAALTTLSQHLPPNNNIHLISASATGYYGSSCNENTVTETASAGSDFLAELCVKWEQAAYTSGFSGIGIARIGVVLDSKEGAFPIMVKPIRMGIGAVPGTGKQGISWIHIADVVRGLEWMARGKAQGVFNFTAPNPVSMRSFMQAVSKKYQMPLWPVGIPEIVLSLALGEKSVLACQGVYAIPEALLKNHFSFLYPGIAEAIQDF